MEVINNNRPQGGQSKSPSSRNLYFGVILMAAGLLWLLNNFNILNFRFVDIIFSWQMLMIVIGGYLMTLKKWAGGAIVAGIGLLFMITEKFDIYLPIGKVILPATLILLGIVLLVQRKG